MGIAERRLREKQARKQTILEAAESLIFERGLDATSMDEVAKKAELSKGTLYLYYTNKNDLYRAVLRRAYNTLHQHLIELNMSGKNGLEAVLAICSSYISFAQVQPGYFQAIAHYHSDNVWQAQHSQKDDSTVAGNEVLQFFTKQIERGLADGSISLHVSPLSSALILWGMYTGVLQMLQSKKLFFQEYFELSEEGLLQHLTQLTKYCLAHTNTH